VTPNSSHLPACTMTYPEFHHIGFKVACVLLGLKGLQMMDAHASDRYNQNAKQFEKFINAVEKQNRLLEYITHTLHNKK
jgi:hypothetical protein